MNASEAVQSVVEHVTSATQHLLSPFDTSQHGRLSLRRLLGNLPGMVYRCRNDRDWTMEFVSQGSVALTGFAPQDLVEGGVAKYGDLIHPDDRGRVGRQVQEAVSERSGFQLTYRLRRVDGRELWVREQGCPVTDEVGTVVALEGFVTDITDREELSRRAVDQVANRLRGTVDGAPDEQRLEFRGLRKDRADCDLEIHGRRLDSGGGAVAIGALLDISQRRSAQRRHHEHKRMESLGHLAAGVAHDFRNILAVIKTSAQVLLSERSPDPNLAREPYFTTKGDRGTGLGLPNIWRIVRDAGGTIEVASEVGVVSTFRIFLPVSTGD